MINREQTLSSQSIYQGSVINLRVDQVQAKGKIAKREIVEHCGAVCGVGITKDDKLVLIKQYRKAIERELIEIPAGKLNLGEKPLEAVIREFKEETGFDVEDVEFITSFYTTPGFSNEIGHLYFLKCTDLGETNFDEDEDIELLLCNKEEAKEMIFNGEIIDAKTILGIMMFLDKY